MTLKDDAFDKASLFALSQEETEKISAQMRAKRQEIDATHDRINTEINAIYAQAETDTNAKNEERDREVGRMEQELEALRAKQATANKTRGENQQAYLAAMARYREPE